jgi:hypothetical protein
MKKILLLSCILNLPMILLAQWNSSTVPHMYNTNSGNVGIGTGTSAPLDKLHIIGNLAIQPDATTTPSYINFKRLSDGWIAARLGQAYGQFSYGGHLIFETNAGATSTSLVERMRITYDGKIGIGTSSPRGKFDIDGTGDIYLSDDVNTGTTQSLYIPGHIYVSPYNGGNVSYLQARRADNSGSTSLQLRTTNAGTLVEAMMITSGGNVGIGTISPDAKLAVKGTVHAQEVKVDLQGAIAPDYVFEKDYDLLTLKEVEEYIAMHKHLPEIPAGKELETNGVKLGEMNMLLLKKVEELTLYILEQEKRIQKLEEGR